MKRLLIGDKDISNMLRLNGEYVNVPFPELTSVNFFIVAGGGGGGPGEPELVTPAPGGGGGGAGGVITGSIDIYSLESYTVSVGTGGNGGRTLAGQNGGNTTFAGLTAIGGGGGGRGLGGSISDCTNGNGRNGGSGGGQGANPYYGNTCATGSGLQPTSESGGFGNNGGPAISLVSGGGGGALGPSVSTVGGPAFVWEEDGEYYAAGGNANSSPANNTVSGSGGYGGQREEYGMDGLDGIAVIWYEGPVRAFGGTITENDGKTYHTFTSSSAFYAVR